MGRWQPTLLIVHPLSSVVMPLHKLDYNDEKEIADAEAVDSQ